MDGGIEQNPAYGTALTFTYAECVLWRGVLTTILTPTDRKEWPNRWKRGGDRVGSPSWLRRVLC